MTRVSAVNRRPLLLVVYWDTVYTYFNIFYLIERKKYYIFECHNAVCHIVQHEISTYQYLHFHFGFDSLSNSQRWQDANSNHSNLQNMAYSHKNWFYKWGSRFGVVLCKLHPTIERHLTLFTLKSSPLLITVLHQKKET